MTNIQKTPSNVRDIVGVTYGGLIVLSFDYIRNGRPYWNCLCVCGTKKTIDGNNLKRGHTKSCGCLLKIGPIKHGETRGKKPKEYLAWEGIKKRCYYTKSTQYHCYGKRGIMVCDRWRNSYEHFLLDMGRAPSKNHSIDRIDVNGNYEPSNCRWATKEEQSNNRRTNVFYEIGGIKKTLSQLCEEYGVVQYETAYSRVKLRNWDIIKAVTKPSRNIK